MNRSFPALRGLAIVLVVLNHSITRYNTGASSQGIVITGTWEKVLLSFLSGLGTAYAVPIFLYLSGAFFAYGASTDNLKKDYRVVWNNVKHVVIPYVIWSVVFYVEIFFLHDIQFTPEEYIKKLLVGYPYNFVPLLIFFYLVSPLIIRVMRNLGWLTIALIGLYQLVLLNIVHPGMLGFQFPDWMSILAPPVLSTTMAEWAIFFPLGLIYVMRITSQTEFVEKTKGVWVSLTVILYAISLLDALEVVSMPLARYLAAVPFMLLASILKRNSIPYVKQLEALGKKAYGLYLMNLIVLDILLLLLESFLPGLMAYYLLLIPLLFVLALLIPLWIINRFEQFGRPVFHRYVFG